MKLKEELDLHIFLNILLFEGTKNIERGKWFDIVSSNGGSNNANTSHDRTYYYETFPSNSLEIALWLESERMFIQLSIKLGVDTQNEVVKEEKRQRIDNAIWCSYLRYCGRSLFVSKTSIWKICNWKNGRS